VDKDLYAGGFPGLLEWYQDKQTPFVALEEVLPPEPVDLGALAARIVPPHDGASTDHPDGTGRKKLAALQKDLAGQSELALLHALLIAILRRRDPPDGVNRLYFRIWREQGAFLAEHLSMRWMISAATTFADHGETTDQRVLGMGLSIAFDMIKIHDSERRLTGQPGRKPFDRTRGWRRTPLAFDLNAYSLKGGDLDRNMLARLWALSEKDPVIKPLAQAMLTRAMQDRRSIFGRMQRIKLRNDTLDVLNILSDD
jgi:hypothetical protein